jgi:hypothetical protein
MRTYPHRPDARECRIRYAAARETQIAPETTQQKLGTANTVSALSGQARQFVDIASFAYGLEEPIDTVRIALLEATQRFSSALLTNEQSGIRGRSAKWVALGVIIDTDAELFALIDRLDRPDADPKQQKSPFLLVDALLALQRNDDEAAERFALQMTDDLASARCAPPTRKLFDQFDRIVAGIVNRDEAALATAVEKRTLLTSKHYATAEGRIHPEGLLDLVLTAMTKLAANRSVAMFGSPYAAIEVVP